jgi:hypothetical protein
MKQELVALRQTRETINHLVQGVDPFTGEVLEHADFIQNPQMIRSFALMCDVLTQAMERSKGGTPKTPFYMSQEELNRVVFPKGDIGVLQVVKAINSVILDESRGKLTAAMLNKALKKAGILSSADEQEQYRTIVNDTSKTYGIFEVESVYKDEKYMKVTYSDLAKQYLIDNLISLIGL